MGEIPAARFVIVEKPRQRIRRARATITNLAAGISSTALSHQEVLEVGRQVGQALGTIVKGVLRRL